jgi:hypothetical protein
VAGAETAVAVTGALVTTRRTLVSVEVTGVADALGRPDSD